MGQKRHGSDVMAISAFPLNSVEGSRSPRCRFGERRIARSQPDSSEKISCRGVHRGFVHRICSTDVA